MATQNQNPELIGPAYGIRQFDLSTDRATEDDFEPIWLTETTVITPTQVPDECYIRFGSKTNARIDLRDFEGRPLRSQSGNSFGVSYLENPTSATGTLEFLQGIALVTAGGGGGSSPSTGAGFVEASDSGTGSGNAATLTIGEARDDVNILVDTSGAATLTVEVQKADGTWVEYDSVDYGSAVETYEAYSTVVATDIRAHLDANRNSVTIQAKGAP